MRTLWFQSSLLFKKYYRTSPLIKWIDFLFLHLQRYWFRASILGCIALLLWHKDLSFQLDLSAARPLTLTQSVNTTTQSILPLAFFSDKTPATTPPASSTIAQNAEKDNLSNTYSNMSFEGEANISTLQKSTSYSLKRKKQEAYIQRFAKVAQAEMKQFGIPASIKLAQGLIESNAGESRLSRKNNNHFGMKCFSRKCKKGHCSNFTDDSHKDFFRSYSSAWESYRAHSKMLSGKRYRHLRKHGKDFKSWAHGLKKAGYATDKRYAQKLIHLIKDLKLNRFDN